MGLFSFLKGKPKVDLAELIRGGAKLVDVRSKAEYASGREAGVKEKEQLVTLLKSFQ